MKHLTLTLILALLAAPAFATDAPPEKPPEKPPAKTPERQPTDKGNPYVTYEAQHWTGVCEYLPDGRILVHTAFLRNPRIAAQQCRDWLEEKQ